MSDELKTLKDIKLLVEDMPKVEIGENTDGIVVFKAKLRQEAIKWIKSMPEWYSYEDSSEFPQFYEDIDNGFSCGNLHEFLKHFFNITEEDLK